MTLRVEQLNAPSLSIRLIETKEMRERVGITFENLWKLHNITLDGKEKPRSVPVIPKITEMLIQHFRIEEDKKKWNSWKTEFQKTELFATCPFDDVRTMLANITPPILTAQDLANYYNSIKREDEGIWELKNAKRWVKDNIWLEDFVLHAVQSISQKVDISDSILGVKTDKKKGHYFEVDVIALRGYQVFVFSCTTATSDSDCKEKLFEVSLRAKQLGGDEARFALVCFHPKKREIKKEIGGLITENIFEVFDEGDLSNLPQAIENWIRKVDREVV
jgi:hypothetical protein